MPHSDPLSEDMRKRADEIQSGDPLSGISVKWEGMPDYKSVTVPNIAAPRRGT